MAKILGVVLIGVYLVWFFTVQAVSVSTEDVSEQEIGMMENSKTELHLTQTGMHDTIVNVAEKEGWNTTEFKSNALIAEKMMEENSISVIITFSKSEFFISPENIDLQNAINSTLGI